MSASLSSRRGARTTASITSKRSKMKSILLGYIIGTLQALILMLLHYLYCSPMDSSDVSLLFLLNNTAAATTTSSTKDIAAGCNPEICRSRIFHSIGQGGHAVLEESLVRRLCNVKYNYQACDELALFSGLQPDEMMRRLRREANFHFEGEHLFWNPQSPSELAFYYVSSVNYLFANALHATDRSLLRMIFEKERHEPILDYSGGVGNNVLYLAGMGFKCQYFGIGLLEKAFAEHRFRKRGYLDNGLVEMKYPFFNGTFDPINSVLPRDESLGAIVATDVLEHIPNYHLVVKAMVESLKVGGVIIENSPFATDTVKTNDQDVRVHVSNGGVKMPRAMSKKMVFTDPQNGIWTKIMSTRKQ